MFAVIFLSIRRNNLSLYRKYQIHPYVCHSASTMKPLRLDKKNGQGRSTGFSSDRR